ncbi:hypothetical protein E2C01_054190 [Portunus trituberculatus]|uniref:Uncharacterized protein n=1 Tax=Portunus trituberculatus TaxID=210409 RepID=A0A5B7GIM2_PORTR|nr:hypothetical protein [Portunus trituberculatus]
MTSQVASSGRKEFCISSPEIQRLTMERKAAEKGRRVESVRLCVVKLAALTEHAWWHGQGPPRAHASPKRLVMEMTGQ